MTPEKTSSQGPLIFESSRPKSPSMARTLIESSQTAGEIMVHAVVTLSPDSNLLNAAITLRRHAITGAPVSSEGKIVGVLSQKDIVSVLEARSEVNLPSTILDMVVERVDQTYLDRLSSCRGILEQMVVRDAMSPEVISVAPSASLREVVHRMAAHHIHRVPVVEHGRLVGIVTRTDVLRVLAGLPEEPRAKRAGAAPMAAPRVTSASRAYR
jgi:CBS domain-containing protein